MRELLSGSCQGINALYTAKRLDKLLLSPPADNPRNIIDYSLFYVHHKVSAPLTGHEHTRKILLDQDNKVLS